jgi:uncharacterized protein YqeY
MSLESKLMTDLKEAMKAKDQPSLRGIRAVKAELLKFKTSGTGEELNEEAEIKILQRLVKQRQDSLSIFEEQGREDLAVVEREEIAVITKYLPAQLSPEELKEKVQEIITQTGASSMKDMGKVMGMASKAFAGKADGKSISTMVKELLS